MYFKLFNTLYKNYLKQKTYNIVIYADNNDQIII